MRTWTIALALVLAGAGTGTAHAQNPFDAARKAAGVSVSVTGSATLEKEVNKRLLAESRKNQCSFKTDSDQLMPGCGPKVKKLAQTIIDVKKKLDAAAVGNFRFEVSGHTDSTGKADHNKELSMRRAAVMVKELVAKGIAQKEIVAVGMGSERPVVTPDDTEGKRKKNRRYEIQVRM